jgi:hypothetical protein
LTTLYQIKAVSDEVTLIALPPALAHAIHGMAESGVNGQLVMNFHAGEAPSFDLRGCFKNSTTRKSLDTALRLWTTLHGD